MTIISLYPSCVFVLIFDYFRFVACVSCLVLSVLATIDDLAIELLSNIVMYIVSTLFAKQQLMLF